MISILTPFLAAYSFDNTLKLNVSSVSAVKFPKSWFIIVKSFETSSGWVLSISKKRFTTILMLLSVPNTFSFDILLN